MNYFINGAAMMGCIIAGLFFLRFRQKTGDRFFAIFSMAFWMLALERVFLAFTDPAHESRGYIYLIRLTAFILILAAGIDKNRTAKRKG